MTYPWTWIYSIRLIARAIERFYAKAKSLGADTGYVATNRRAWWSVGLRAAAPILTTYMARRPPAFVHNRAEARHLNIAHGIYPRESFGQTVLDNLVAYSRKSVQSNTRTNVCGWADEIRAQRSRAPLRTWTANCLHKGTV